MGRFCCCGVALRCIVLSIKIDCIYKMHAVGILVGSSIMHSLRQRVLILYSGLHLFPLKIPPSHEGPVPHLGLGFCRQKPVSAEHEVLTS